MYESVDGQVVAGSVGKKPLLDQHLYQQLLESVLEFAGETVHRNLKKKYLQSWYCTGNQDLLD